MLSIASVAALAQYDYPAHYLVGLANYPNADVPEIFQGVTSGSAKARQSGQQTCAESNFASAWCDTEFGPWNYVPSVGFSDIEFYYDADGNKVADEFLCLTDNGFGSSTNSYDYPLHINHQKIKVRLPSRAFAPALLLTHTRNRRNLHAPSPTPTPETLSQVPFTFRHGGSTFPAYATTESKNIILLHDPDKHIKWEGGQDIQVTYGTPDASWDTFKSLRVLTGRDFDVEGLAVKNHTYAIVGDELMPALFPIDASTGKVLGPMVRTPDIDTEGNFNGKFLSSAGDKVHCSIASLQANECMAVDTSVVDASDYVRHGTSGGYEGLAMMADGSVTAFLERNTGSTLAARGEPGVRVFHVQSDPLKFESFLGFYAHEKGACCIADISPVPGSNTKLLVAERADWPNSKYALTQGQPNNRLCMIDTSIRNADMTFVKKCILNYQHVSDPFDVDGDGLTTTAFSQWTTEQLIIVSDNCLVAGTDTNFPGVNQFGLTSAEAPYLQEVSDTRFMVVCFDEPVLSADFVHIHPHAATAPKLSDAMDCSGDEHCPVGTMCMCVNQKGSVPTRMPLFSALPQQDQGVCKCLAM